MSLVHRAWRRVPAALLAASLLSVVAGCDPGTRVRPPSERTAPAPVSRPTTDTRPVDHDNPFVGRQLFVDPSSNAARDAAALATSDPTSAAALRKVASQPQADWFGDWNPTSRVTADVAGRVRQVTTAGAYPVLVLYNIPKRDCSGYSGGGATSPDEYRAWIRAVAAGIGAHEVAVILEPDALAQVSCLSAADTAERLSLIADATRTLSGAGGASVYIDAGNAGWVASDVMARRLRDAGAARARGFSLNVSNFGTTADQVAYGRRISRAGGGDHLVVDTSRNGVGPATGLAEAWCNPPGRALGAKPTAATGDPLVDAHLWLKRPGESDGTCNGGPAAGVWWRDYAIGLAQRAGW